jgi:uncharacterized protein
MQYVFDWNPQKALANVQNHGIAFERATTIFRDTNLLSIFDEAHSDENRWITLGLDSTGTLFVVTHTYNQTNSPLINIWIIFALEADEEETQQYQKGLS